MTSGARLVILLIAALCLAGCAMIQPLRNRTVRQHSGAGAAEQGTRPAAAGRMDEAGANLERALRIEPRNPVLWQELARVRLHQGQYRQAENLAAKSNALAGGNRYLQAENWRVIGEARNRRGDLEGARAAFKEAEEQTP